MGLLIGLTAPYRKVLPQFGGTMITCWWDIVDSSMVIRKIVATPSSTPAGIGLSTPHGQAGWIDMLRLAPRVATLLKTAIHYYESFLNDIDEISTPGISALRHEFVIAHSAKFTELVLNKDTKWDMRCDIEIPDLSGFVREIIKYNCSFEKRRIPTGLRDDPPTPMRVVWNPFFDFEVEHAERLFVDEVGKGRRAYKSDGDRWTRIFDFRANDGEVLLAFPKKAKQQAAETEQVISLIELHSKIKIVLDKYKHRKVTFKMESPNGHRVLCETSS